MSDSARPRPSAHDRATNPIAGVPFRSPRPFHASRDRVPSSFLLIGARKLPLHFAGVLIAADGWLRPDDTSEPRHPSSFTTIRLRRQDRAGLPLFLHRDQCAKPVRRRGPASMRGRAGSARHPTRGGNTREALPRLQPAGSWKLRDTGAARAEGLTNLANTFDATGDSPLASRAAALPRHRPMPSAPPRG
jgi:hypothetical protein